MTVRCCSAWRSWCAAPILPIVWALLTATACTPAGHTPPALPAGMQRAGASVPGAPFGVTAFVDVAVVPMDTDRVLSHQTVLTEGGRITALGSVRQVRVPAGAVRIAGRGQYLLPGLADMHAHLHMGVHVFGVFWLGPPADSADAEGRLFLWLTNGVTTVRVMDYIGDPDDHYTTPTLWGRQTLRWRALAAAGQDWLPRIYTAGQWGPRQYIQPLDWLDDTAVPPRVDSIAAYLAAYKAAGYDFVKVHDEPPQILDSVLVAARRVGIPVAGHIPAPTRVEHVLALGGYTSIEHPFTDYLWGSRTDTLGPGWRDREASDTAGFSVLAGALRRAGVWHCPTQAHYDRLHTQNAWASPALLNVEQDSGVKLLVGTDEVPWQGVITRELQAFVDAGLTPYQALLADTRNVAEYFGTLQASGTIAVGKRADLVLLTGNPLQDVRYTAQPAGVMLGGRWLPRAEIARRLAQMTVPTVVPLSKDVVKREPVQSYWGNVVDEAVQTTTRLFLDANNNDDEHQIKHWLFRPAHAAQRQALIDALGMSDHYRASTQRVLQLIAQQLGEDRQGLTPAQRTTFDQRAREWLQQRHREGYAVTILGVR